MTRLWQFRIPRGIGRADIVELEPAIDFACSRASTSNISGGSLNSSSLPAKQMRKTPSCKSKGPGRKRRVSTETDITSVFLAARERKPRDMRGDARIDCDDAGGERQRQPLARVQRGRDA